MQGWKGNFQKSAELCIQERATTVTKKVIWAVFPQTQVHWCFYCDWRILTAQTNTRWSALDQDISLSSQYSLVTVQQSEQPILFTQVTILPTCSRATLNQVKAGRDIHFCWQRGSSMAKQVTMQNSLKKITNNTQIHTRSFKTQTCMLAQLRADPSLSWVHTQFVLFHSSLTMAEIQRSGGCLRAKAVSASWMSIAFTAAAAAAVRFLCGVLINVHVQVAPSPAQQNRPIINPDSLALYWTCQQTHGLLQAGGSTTSGSLLKEKACEARRETTITFFTPEVDKKQQLNAVKKRHLWQRWNTTIHFHSPIETSN